VLAQLPECPAQKKNGYAVVVERQQHKLHAHRPAFAAASCAAVGNIPASGIKKRLLLGVGRKNYSFFVSRHNDQSPALPLSTIVHPDRALLSGLSEYPWLFLKSKQKTVGGMSPFMASCFL